MERKGDTLNTTFKAFSLFAYMFAFIAIAILFSLVVYILIALYDSKHHGQTFVFTNLSSRALKNAEKCLKLKQYFAFEKHMNRAFSFDRNFVFNWLNNSLEDRYDFAIDMIKSYILISNTALSKRFIKDMLQSIKIHSDDLVEIEKIIELKTGCS